MADLYPSARAELDDPHWLLETGHNKTEDGRLNVYLLAENAADSVIIDGPPAVMERIISMLAIALNDLSDDDGGG